jgi:UDP-N-acetylglucosamine/UDP-N-acetylgalactosamine diphosphorylase
VLEYSELDPATASATNPDTGKLYYNWSNICMHYFSLSWLKAAAQHLRTAAVYHIAHKQIPAKGGVKVPGLKLEMFIFDPFHTAEKTTLFEVRPEIAVRPRVDTQVTKATAHTGSRSVCQAMTSTRAAEVGLSAC